MNPGIDEPLVLVAFMNGPELVEQFRAIHKRVKLDPDRPITAEERLDIKVRLEKRTYLVDMIFLQMQANCSFLKYTSPFV